MSAVVWIGVLESRGETVVTYLEVQVNESLTRCVQLARAWFAASPEARLEVQGFRVDAKLLTQVGEFAVQTGLHAERPLDVKPATEAIDEALLCVSKDAVWFAVRSARAATRETAKVTDDFSLRIAFAQPVVDAQEQITQVTLALELVILHEGVFDVFALEELLSNLDFALEQQRGNASLAPESVDGVTEHFVFRVLDIRPLPTAFTGW